MVSLEGIDHLVGLNGRLKNTKVFKKAGSTGVQNIYSGTLHPKDTRHEEAHLEQLKTQQELENNDGLSLTLA